MSDSEDDFEWRPPTEAEKKILEARRERSNKISKLMGEYMLKGYRMLATTCPVCATIELQDQQGRIYCVACSEVDNDENSKDNPVLSAAAASHQIAEEVQRQAQIEPLTASRRIDEPSRQTFRQPVTSPLSTSTSGIVSQAATSSANDSVQESLSTVLNKMQNAAKALATAESIETSRNLVGLIKDCADCILSLQQISRH